MVYKQIFFSHTWRPDNQDRNNHERVYEIARKLRHYGWTTWVDQDDMKSNIDVDMVNGIQIFMGFSIGNHYQGSIKTSRGC